MFGPRPLNPTEQGKNKMQKKYICCVHDKKADTFDGFMMFDNISQATRSFQQVCEKNEVFRKWPEDFEFVLVGEIQYQNGTLNEKNEIEEKAEIKELKFHGLILSRAQEYVAIANAKDTK